MIEMVDLKKQYQTIKPDIDTAISSSLASADFINGKAVSEFSQSLAHYLDVKYVIPCANGTDALQIAMMAFELKPGDEVIVPAFTYVSTAEVLALLGLVPVMVDVSDDTFNINADLIEVAITPKTKAIVPVHLFGQSAPMEDILKIAAKHKLFVIEDNAQAIGADYAYSDGNTQKLGTIGTIGCTSFFPTKNLGCYGDGGALFTNDEALAKRIQMIANHGQEVKYYHKIVGCNSRLDSIQAAVLTIKLKHLDTYIKNRQRAATFYDKELESVDGIQIPRRNPHSTHVFHQYTLMVDPSKRDSLKKHLADRGIPSMIYYPLPLNQQEAFKGISKTSGDLKISQRLAESVLSLPMHTELDEEQLGYICANVKQFFN